MPFFVDTVRPIGGLPVFDAASSTSTTSATSLTWTHTCAYGPERFLWVTVAGIVGGTIGTGGIRVTANGRTVGTIDAANREAANPACWMLGLANPDPGPNTISVTGLTSGQSIIAAAMSASGVDHIAQYGAAAIANASTATAQLTLTPQTHELVVGAIISGVPAPTLTPTSGHTEAVNVQTSNGYMGLSLIYGPQANPAWTLSAGTPWAVAAVCLRPVGVPQARPLPGRRIWESNMVVKGAVAAGVVNTQYTAWGNGADPSIPPLFATTYAYYDGVEVHRRIGEYLGRTDVFFPASNQCQDIMVRGYYVPNGGVVPGYQHFTRGLWLDFVRNATANSKTTVLLLRDNAAYSATGDTTPWQLSRENAYGLNAHIMAGRLGYAPDGTRRATLVTNAYGHLDQWFGSKTARASVPPDDFPAGANGKWTTQPFMVGLTARALIEDYEETADSRCIPALRQAADWMWTNAWDDASQAFWYQNWTSDVTATPIVWGATTAGSTDLNLLIAPLYAWLWLQTGLVAYREQADAIFHGGAIAAFLDENKQFDQNYTWAFDFLTWRGTGR